jgi:hypothetical protein
MEKIKLSITEIVGLEAELNGLVNQENGEVISKGLFGEKLDLVTKYRLKKLSDALTAEKKIVDDLRQELVKKFGKEEEGGRFSIPMWADEEQKAEHPDFTEFKKQYDALLVEEKEFEYNPLSVEDIKDIKSDQRYDLVFRLIKED